MTNCPSDVVTVACSNPVAWSLATTVAPSTMAPEGSVTVPLIAPRKVCAQPVNATSARTTAASVKRRRNRRDKRGLTYWDSIVKTYHENDCDTPGNTPHAQLAPVKSRSVELSKL